MNTHTYFAAAVVNGKHTEFLVTKEPGKVIRQEPTGVTYKSYSAAMKALAAKNRGNGMTSTEITETVEYI